jgi:hypothetical protein
MFAKSPQEGVCGKTSDAIKVGEQAGNGYVGSPAAIYQIEVYSK